MECSVAVGNDLSSSKAFGSSREMLYASGIRKANDLLLLLCLLFALSSSFQMFGIFDLVNKGIMGVLCLLILAVLFVKRQSKLSVFLLVILMLLHVIALAFPISPKEGIATYFMYAFWGLFWIYVSNNSEDFARAAKRGQRILRGALLLWTLATAVSFFLPFCYKPGWGGGRYFTSFTTDSFEVAPIAMLMLAINILLYKIDGDRRRALLLAVVPVACVFMAGTRTYLAVVILEFVLLLHMVIKSKRAFVASVAVAVVIFVALAMVSNIGQKFESAMLDTNNISVFLDVFTNGRSEFWAIDMQAFFDSNPFCIAFGHGFSFVYDLNQQAIGVRLYAHNDFINVLLGFGVLGLVVYLATFMPVVLLVRRRAGRPLCLLFLAMWLLNAFFNMIYVYVAAVIAMGMLAIALSSCFEEEHGCLSSGHSAA